MSAASRLLRLWGAESAQPLILGIVSVVGPYFAPALGLAIVIGSVLTTVWVFLAGCRLYGAGTGSPTF
jgi:hypothetical protein